MIYKFRYGGRRQTNIFSLRYFRYYAADSYCTEPLIYFQLCHLFRIFLITGFSSFWILKYAIRHLIGDWLSPRYFRYDAIDSYSTALLKYILRSHHLDRIFCCRFQLFLVNSGFKIHKQSGQFRDWSSPLLSGIMRLIRVVISFDVIIYNEFFHCRYLLLISKIKAIHDKP